MTCPSCGGELVPGAERCPVCDSSVAPRVEGALTADPRLLTPPARAKVRAEPAAAKDGPIREIPGLRKREVRDARERADRSWRDEVQERVRSRRQKRSEAGLPLFEQEAVQPRTTAPEPPPAPPQPRAESLVAREAQAPAAERVAVSPVQTADVAGSETSDHDLLSPALSEAELADLPLRPALAVAGGELELEADAVASPRPRSRPPSLDDELLVDEPDLESGLGREPPPSEPAPIERPARAAERAQAAAFDLALFAAIATVVAYFAGRAARVELATLAASWPWFLGFLAVLATFYACYFSGTTGQTPGKLITGLRVVDASGRPPHYARATARALVGLLGVALAGVGLVPMAFDPAGRALHDRLFRTRVVRH